MIGLAEHHYFFSLEDPGKTVEAAPAATLLAV
jgi:hypothetical protein